MTGEKDLETLLASMAPELIDEEYVFCTFPEGRYGDHVEQEPFATIRESEGLTLILPKSRADAAGTSYESVYRRITLRVHSSLDAVGLTAAFANALAEHGISANVVAGFYHDHIFVPSHEAARAVQVLEALADAAPW